MTQDFIDVLTGINPMIFEEDSADLLEDGIIDSFDIINIIAKLEEGFSVKFNANDLSGENFSSVQSIWDMLEKSKGGV